MSKKIALTLIMVMLVNMAVWADVTYEEALEAGMPVWAIVLIVFGVAALSVGFALLTSEADAPDDGVRLTSTETANDEPNPVVGSFINVLQHVEVGTTQDNRIYTGLRFRF